MVMSEVRGGRKPTMVRDPGEVGALFAENLGRVRTPGAPDLLVPPDCRTLFAPTEPFMTVVDLKLSVGRQRLEVLHVSDYGRGEEALNARAAGGVLSQAFEPRPFRLVRRHLGVGHVNKGGPWMFDEPALTDVRRLISAPFKPAQVVVLHREIQGVCQQVLREMLRVDARSLDVGTYANEVYFRLMAHIMGVDQGLAPVFREWMRVFNESKSLAALNWQPDIRRRLGRLVSEAEAAQTTGQPAQGLLGQLAAARLDRARIGRWRLRRSDVISLLWAVIAAGTDTPGTAATSTVFFTLQSGEFPRLTDYHAAKRAVAESIRFYPPFPKPLMKARTDCTVGGYQLKKNQWVEVHLPAVNRDPDVFLDPHRFDPDRRDAKCARPFGEVPHYCLGSHFSHQVGAHLVTTLATTVPGLSLLPHPRPYQRYNGLLHRLESLPTSTNLELAGEQHRAAIP